MIINIFYSDNNNIAHIKTQNCQIIANIAYKILIFESMIKNPIVANHAFFTSIIFKMIKSFTYNNFIAIQHL